MALIVLAVLQLGLSARPATASLPRRDSERPSISQPVPSKTPRLTHGPILGRIRQESVVIWLRTDTAAKVSAEVSQSPDFDSFRSARAATESKTDFTAKLTLANLRAGTDYHFRIAVNGKLQPAIARFRTVPPLGSEPLKLAVLSDFQARHPAPVFRQVARVDPDVLVLLGDFDHRNPETLQEFRGMHRECLGRASKLGTSLETWLLHRYPKREIPLLHAWDDHDYGANNSDRTLAQRTAALQAFQEYYVLQSDDAVLGGKLDGVWQSLRYGCVELFLLDVRSNRDPGNLRKPNKSMLGPRQKDWLKAGLLSSSARWKIVLSGVPFNPDCKPFDGWGRYPRERAELLDFIKGNRIDGVVVASGDIHSGGAIDDGTHSGLPEVSIPHANLRGFNDTARGLIGKWTGGYLSGAVGPGYALFQADPSRLTITVRDQKNVIRKSLTLRSSARAEPITVAYR